MTRWYRAYAGTIKDDKLAEAAVVAGCSRSVVIATWHAILESAAETAGGGRFDTTSRRVAAALGEPASVIEAVFSAMQEIGLVSGSEIPAWKRRQYESDNDFRRSPAWRLRRLEVFDRDDFTCTYCGARGGLLQCDHVHPLSRGGSHDLGNLTTACRACNQSKRDKLLSEWRA